MPEIGKYKAAYLELFQTGLVKHDKLQEQIKVFQALDDIAPSLSSFFYIMLPSTGRYLFLGKQQETVSGIANSLLMQQGVESVFRRIHPKDLPILVQQIFPDCTRWFQQRDPALDNKSIFFQFNYRFRNGQGTYLTLMEHLRFLEINEQGTATVILGNVITLGSMHSPPMQCSMNIHWPNLTETVQEKIYTNQNQLLPLTRRERDILRNLALGKTSKQIGTSLYISPHTVDTHRRNILRKLHCSSVVELAQIAFQSGLI